MALISIRSKRPNTEMAMKVLCAVAYTLTPYYAFRLIKDSCKKNIELATRRELTYQERKLLEESGVVTKTIKI